MQDLNDLQYFAQVVRHSGFSAASRATGEPKSKLSKRVAQLERDLGVRLIERSTRSIQVTEVGRDVFAQCEVIAGGLEATEAIVARSRDEVRGSLRVSCPPQLPYILGSGPMTTFLSRYPLVRVQLHLSNRRGPAARARRDAPVKSRCRASRGNRFHPTSRRDPPPMRCAGRGLWATGARARGSRVRNGLAAGGRWIRTIGPWRKAVAPESKVCN